MTKDTHTKFYLAPFLFCFVFDGTDEKKKDIVDSVVVKVLNTV